VAVVRAACPCHTLALELQGLLLSRRKRYGMFDFGISAHFYGLWHTINSWVGIPFIEKT
jgi:hypothetical protein